MTSKNDSAAPSFAAATGDTALVTLLALGLAADQKRAPDEALRQSVQEQLVAFQVGADARRAARHHAGAPLLLRPSP